MAKASVQVHGLTDVETAALSKIKGKDLQPGDHAFDFVVHVRGCLRKGESYETTPTVSIPIKKALALFIQHCGITRETALAKLEKAMREALDGNSPASETLETLEKAEKRVIKSIGNLPKVPRAGSTTLVGDLVVERLETAPAGVRTTTE